MKKSFASVFALGATALILSGCGGEGAATAVVTGTVVDLDFNPVRDARVVADGVETRTTSTGTFTLTGLKEAEVLVVATVERGGVTFRGRTTVRTAADSQENGASIVVAPISQMGAITGTVRDRQGFTLSGASVYAFTGSGASQRAFTDRNGRFGFSEIPANVDLRLSASGRGYRSDQTTVNLSIGQNRTVDFVLDNANLPLLTAPQNLGATSWVTFPSSRDRDGVAWVKQRWAQRDERERGTRVGGSKSDTRLRPDMSVETELFWDEQNFPDLLGWGIYRANSANGTLNGIDLFADPLAAYYVDVGLQPNSIYSYAVTTLATLFPDFNQTESQASNRVVVNTLNLINVLDPLLSPVQFRWVAVPGATQYVVYVFDRFPSVGVTSLWTNESSPSTTSSVNYSGPSLIPGRTYYYLVLGLSGDNTNRTISQVRTFIP